jgi:di/tricarboxylate transporter
MKSRFLVLAAVAVLGMSTHAASAQQVQVGTLSCEVAGGPGMIIASNRALRCVYQDASGDRPEFYQGSITKFGVDIGATSTGRLAWAVFAPTAGAPRGALAGSYGGVTGSVTVGVGLGANVLVGGNAQTIALQPVSIDSQTGLNVAAGIAGLTLAYVPQPHHHRHHHRHY